MMKLLRYVVFCLSYLMGLGTANSATIECAFMSGEIYDLTGSYQMAFLNGIAWNLLNMSIAFWLLAGRQKSTTATA